MVVTQWVSSCEQRIIYLCSSTRGVFTWLKQSASCKKYQAVLFS